MEKIHCMQAGCSFVCSSMEDLLEHQNKTGHNR